VPPVEAKASAPALKGIPVAVRLAAVVPAVTADRLAMGLDWSRDRLFLCPELVARAAKGDSYFGFMARRIEAAYAAGDLQTAGELVRQYVYQWDNVYKVHRFPEPSAGSAR
jgi:hypothetical protein